jgi:transcription elongation factor Elf1
MMELKGLRERQPDLSEAIDMHLELLELQRRVQGRVPLPSVDMNADMIARHVAEARPLLRFEDIPLDITNLRLMVRQTADVLRRFDALDTSDHQLAEAMGRDAGLADLASQWYRRAVGHHAVAGIGVGTGADPGQSHAAIDQVLALALRPFLARCAEVLQPRAELAAWTHPHCPMCGGEPDLAVIQPSAERHLICGRCSLRWKFEPLTCPYCRNSDRSKITSFATPDGQYRVYACDICQRYLKAYDGRRATRPVMPVVDSVATLPLDAAAIQRGYSSD